MAVEPKQAAERSRVMDLDILVRRAKPFELPRRADEKAPSRR
jgi:hypothetical protein